MQFFSFRVLTFFIGCSIDSGRSLEVVSRSSDYNAVGEFRCSNDGSLYYSNKTKVVSNKTKCLAQWEDSDVVQCWTGAVFLRLFIAFCLQQLQEP